MKEESNKKQRKKKKGLCWKREKREAEEKEKENGSAENERNASENFDIQWGGMIGKEKRNMGWKLRKPPKLPSTDFHEQNCSELNFFVQKRILSFI